MPGPGDFIKKNIQDSVGKTLTDQKLGKGFIAFDIANLVASENKLKAIGKLLKDLILFGPLLNAGFATMFLGMTKGIRSLVHDTGSLEAALNKLKQIQGLQKIFTGILGGVAQAKLKVAELVNFAASKNIKLGDAAEAARSLQIMTRGGFASAHALDVVLDAAKATGTGFTDMADAVGEFSDQLQSGGPINGATEQLRKMGVITNETADNFLELQKNGASAGQIFGALTTELERFKGGAEDARDSIEGINEAYDKASVNLQEKFGSPFVESDVVNTKNWTDAMNAVSPAVERVSNVFAILSNGFSTAKSAAAKYTAESTVLSGALEALVYVMTAVVTVASAWGAIALSTWLITAAGAASTAIGGVAGFAAASVLAATGVGVLVAAVAIAGGVLYQWSAAVERTAKKLQDLQQAQNAADQSLRQQIRNVRTLSQYHEVLAKALDSVTQAQIELTAAQATGSKADIENARSVLEMRKRTAAAAERRGTAGLAPGVEEEASKARAIDRARAIKEETFQGSLELARPGEKSTLIGQHIADLKGKAARGAADEKLGVNASKFKEIADRNVLVTQKEKEAAEENAKSAEAELARAKARASTRVGMRGELSRVDAQAVASATDRAGAAQHEAGLKRLAAANALSAQKTGFLAPATSIEGLEAAKARVLASNDSKRGEIAAKIDRDIAEAKRNMEMRTENELEAMRETAAKKALDREIALGKIQLENEAARQEAQLTGDSRTMQRLDDMSVFAEKFQEMLDKGATPGEAQTGAAKFAANAIALDARSSQLQASAGAVVDSLQRIGGGGGSYAPSGDPMLAIGQRQIVLHEAEVAYLKTLADAETRGVL